MPNVHNYYKSESDYLKADDIPVGKQYSVTIKGIEEVRFEGKNGRPDQQKLAATFHETDKKLVLNKTNSMTIASMYGAESDQWLGRSIMLYQTKVSFGDDMVDAVRVDLPRETVNMAPLAAEGGLGLHAGHGAERERIVDPQQAAPQASIEQVDDFEDRDIPF